MTKLFKIFVLLTAVILSMSACVKKEGVPISTPSTSSSSEQRSTSSNEDSGTSDLKPTHPIVLPEDNTSKLPEKEKETINSDGSIVLNGDEYIHYDTLKYNDEEFEVPTLKGEVVSSTENSLTIYNSGVTMKVLIMEALTMEDIFGVGATSEGTDTIKYLFEGEDLIGAIKLSDNTTYVMYEVSCGDNYDTKVYTAALNIFGAGK